MIKDKIHVFTNTTTLSEGFTRFIINDVCNGGDINIALSGGSTPKSIFDYWSQQQDIKLPWKHLRLFWGDERCVPPDNEMSNYKMTKDHLLNYVVIPEDNIFRIHGENKPADEAVFYSDVLDHELPQENSVPRFDLVMLGLGDDGHTVSIFPHEIELWNSPMNCVVAHHPESGMQRVSITGKIVNNARHVAFLATGKNKAEKVKAIIEARNKNINTYPAARVAPKGQILHWFLEEEAASLL